MARVPSPEESGREILKMFSRENIRSGEMLLLQVINTRWISAGKRSEDLQNGLEWLIEQGYLEQKEAKGNDALFLTEAGFEIS